MDNPLVSPAVVNTSTMTHKTRFFCLTKIYKMRLFTTVALISLFVVISASSVGYSVDAVTNETEVDSLQVIRDYYIKIVAETIRGKEKMAVDSVFTNLKVFGGFPAENLLVAMNSWSRALGVTCTHCHTPSQWEDDRKPEKDIARQMSKMTSVITNEYLRKIPGMKNPKSLINCTSCHNGKLKPALRIE